MWIKSYFECHWNIGMYVKVAVAWRRWQSLPLVNVLEYIDILDTFLILFLSIESWSEGEEVIFQDGNEC